MKDNQKVNLRNIVLSMLVESLDGKGFSHILVNDVFSKNNLDENDRAFVSRLYLGTLEQVVYLDYTLGRYSRMRLEKMKPVIKNILRLSLYQMFFMDAVPDHAAINEGVNLAKLRGFGSLQGFVNGILRAVQRDGAPKEVPDFVKFSTPKWLYDFLVEQDGKEMAEAFLANANETKEFVSVRLNLQKKEKEEIITILKEDGCEVKEYDCLYEAVGIKGFSNLTSLSAYKQGLFFVQNISSMYIANVIAGYTDKNQVKVIIDTCAAPGGKSLHLAEKFSESAVIARDVSEAKVKLIEENVKRMGYVNVTSQVFNALKIDEAMLKKADVVVADLPCSGLGVIGNKPDIKHRLKIEDLESLAKLQRDILASVQTMVSENGLLCFSTCTVNKGENEENVKWFTGKYPFELICEKKFYPQDEDDFDGFYIALLRRTY